MSQVIAVLLLSPLIPVSRAQAQQLAPRNLQIAVNQVAQSAQVTPSTISIRFNNTPLRAAVQTIIDRAHIAVIYSPEMLPLNRKVTYKGVNVSAEVALAAILRNTGIRVDRGTSGGLRLTRTPVAPAPTPVPPPDGTIAGKVADASTKLPITGAYVSVDGSAKQVRTDDDGAFRLQSVPAGAHTVTVRAVGYAKMTRQITVTSNAVGTLNITLERSENVLAQVVVTGSVIGTERKAIPNTITVVTAEDIQRRGITELTQLFRGDIPGLLALNTGSLDGFGEVRMYSRGRADLATTPAIKTYVDGVELADPEFLNQLDPKEIERIEVIPGPQASTIYGSAAMNGVMQIFTKHGAVSDQPRVTLSLLHGVVQNNLSDKLAPQQNDAVQVDGGQNDFTYHLGGAYLYTGQWKPGSYTRVMSGDLGSRYTDGPLTASITGRFSKRAFGQGQDSPLYATNVADGRFSLTPFQVAPYTPYARQLSTTQRTLGAVVAYQPTSWWVHNLTIGQDATTTGYVSDSPHYTTPSDSLLLIQTSPQVRTSIAYNTSIKGGLGEYLAGTLTAGADHWQYNYDYSYVQTAEQVGTLTGGGGTTVIQRTDTHNSGEFVQGLIGVFDKVFITAGLRGEQNSNYGVKVGTTYSSRFGVSVTQQVGAVTAKLRAAYGKATLPPDAGSTEEVFGNDLVYGTYPVQLAAPNLRPEEQSGWEEGLELYFGTVGSLSLTHYDQTLGDAILTVYPADSTASLLPDPSTGLYDYTYSYQSANVASMHNDGWEAQGTLRVWRLQGTGTYSFTRSRIGQDISPDFAGNGFLPGGTTFATPEHTASLALSYSTAKTTISLSASMIGQEQVQSDSTTIYRSNARLRILQSRYNTPYPYYGERGGYTTADMNISQALTKHLTALLTVRNIGDSYYNDYSFATPVIGRSTLLGLRIQ